MQNCWMNLNIPPTTSVIPTEKQAVALAVLLAGGDRDALFGSVFGWIRLRALRPRAVLTAGSGAAIPRTSRPPTGPLQSDCVSDQRSGPGMLRTAVDCFVNNNHSVPGHVRSVANGGRRGRSARAGAGCSEGGDASLGSRTRRARAQGSGCASGLGRTDTPLRGDAACESEPSRRGAQRVARNRPRRFRGAF